ncbi:MAG: hypothetical protein HWD61_08275 [Parachlamydiaceae bacterium]|nr:MAG: hypothetical protein HWD61_08275 [Parachlamydiaceae bacterium]
MAIPDSISSKLPAANYYCIYSPSSRTELDQEDFQSFIKNFEGNGLPIVILSYRYGAHAPLFHFRQNIQF